MTKFTMKIAIVVIGLLFSISTVYAATNVYPLFKEWAEVQKNEAKNKVQRNLHESVIHQEELLVLNTNRDIDEANRNISDMRIGTHLVTTTAIQNSLDNHLSILENTTKKIKDKSKSDFNEVVTRVNDRSTSIVESAQTDYHDNLLNLQTNSIDFNKLIETKLKSDEKLEKEIQETIQTISELNQLRESESNPYIKEFIKKKIDFLEELIISLS